MRSLVLIGLVLVCLVLMPTTEGRRKLKREESDRLHDVSGGDEGDDEYDDYFDNLEPCQCGVFMTQQVTLKSGRRGRPRGPPTGLPVVTYESEEPELPCGVSGSKNCISKCLDVILRYLPKAGPLICGSIDRNVEREKAFLFVKNCEPEWTPTNFAAGKEFCCTDGEHHDC